MKKTVIQKIIFISLLMMFIIGTGQVTYSFSYKQENKKEVPSLTIQQKIEKISQDLKNKQKEHIPQQKSLFELFSPLNEHHTQFLNGESFSLEKFHEDLMINHFYHHEKLLEIKTMKELNQLGLGSSFDQAISLEENNQVVEVKNKTISKYEIFNHPVVIMSLFQDNSDLACYLNPLELYIFKGFPINAISYCFISGEFIGGMLYYPSDYKELMEKEIVKLSPYIMIEKSQDFGAVSKIFYIHSSSRYIVDAYVEKK